MMTVEEIAVRKAECEISGLYFNRFFFKQRLSAKMIISAHHKLMQDTLQKVIDGEIKRLIVNIPPGYTKTSMVVINFIARGLCLNPKARFMHLSYSDSLALENSSITRRIVQSDVYQQMWPIKITDDSNSKKKWWTTKGGGVYATSAGGQVTGFRAGYMESGFTGAILLDDCIKPDDALYEERIKVNNRFNETIKSRLAIEDVPIIVIMQRLHKNDLSGYLLRGGSGEKWYHLNLPVFIDQEQKYNPEYKFGIQIKHNLPAGWLWPYKHNEIHRDSLMSHKRTYWSQYMQDPEKHKIEGALWDEDEISKHRVIGLPKNLTTIVIGVDPSGDDGKDDNKADEIGIVTCGKFEGHYYVIDDSSIHGAPIKWATKAVKKYHELKANVMIGEKNYGGAMVEHTIRTVEGGKQVFYKDIVSTRGKLIRAEPISALYAQGLVHHVGNFFKLEEELTTYDGKGKSPNRLDACLEGYTLITTNKGYKFLKDIKINDFVLTRDGFKKVKISDKTGKNKNVFFVIYSNGCYTLGTDNHPIYIDGCFKEIKCLKKKQIVYHQEKLKNLMVKNLPCMKESHIISVLKRDLNLCIMLFGSSIKIKPQRIILYTIKILTKRIMQLKTWNALVNLDMRKFIQKVNVPKEKGKILIISDILLKNGTLVKKVLNGIKNMVKKYGKIENQFIKKNVKYVELNIMLILNVLNFVVKNVFRHLTEKQKDILLKKNVKYVEKNFCKIYIDLLKPVHVHVEEVIQNFMKTDVYNLEVEKKHEYFANDILVHNCVFAMAELSETGDIVEEDFGLNNTNYLLDDDRS